VIDCHVEPAQTHGLVQDLRLPEYHGLGPLRKPRRFSPGFLTDSLHPIAPPGHPHHERLSALWPGGEPYRLHAPAASLARTALYYSGCRASIPGRPMQQPLLHDRTIRGAQVGAD